MDYNMMLSLLEEMYKVYNYEKDADYLFELTLSILLKPI